MEGGRYSRRRFLGYAGAGALAAGATFATARATGLFSEPGTQGFGRMFDLPPFADESPELIDALVEIGRPGGMLDAKDDFGLGAKKLFLEKYILVDDSLYRFVPDKQNPSTRESVAGNTFLAQFIAHDVTFDATSMRFYVNGTLTVAYASPPAPVLNNAPVTIARGSYNGFVGTIDSLRIYNRVLSPAEIAAIAADR